MMLDEMDVLGVKGFLHLAGTLWKGDNCVRRMKWAKRVDQELGAQQFKMFLHRKDFCFRMEVRDRRHQMATRSHTQRLVLQSLELVNHGLGGIRIVDWTPKIHERAHETLVCGQEGLHTLAKGGPTKSLHDLEPFGKPWVQVIPMRGGV